MAPDLPSAVFSAAILARLTTRGSRVGGSRTGLWSLSVALVLALSLLTGGGRAYADDYCPEPNDEPDKACELKADQNVEGMLSSNDDADRFRIEVADGQSVQVTATAKSGLQKLRLEASDGGSLAEVGLGPGQRQVLAERLPAGRYVVYLSGEAGDSGAARAYTIGWKVVGNGPPMPVTSARGSLRDLVLNPADVGERAVQTAGKLLATDVGRVYEAVYERENTIQARRFGPMYLVNRVHVADSADRAQSVYDTWNVFELPEANDARPFESLGDQSMPAFGDASHALGACSKCDDDNPLRSHRLVARFDTVVYSLYTWGRDAGANFDVVMYLALKLPKHLG
jgi:hypothetical protein